MDFRGKVTQFLGETSGTSKAGNPWKKKEWVVETFDQFPKKVKIQCFGDRADSMNLEPGKDYTLFVDIESREFNGRWYTDVSVYRYEEYNGQQNFNHQQAQGGYQQPQQNFNAPYGNGAPYPQTNQNFQSAGEDSDEDLPF